jgi:hypothetical protein
MNAALEGLVGSGIRAIFCPTPTRRVKQWQPEFVMEEEQVPAWFMDALEDMLRQRQLGDGRISLGLGFDSFEIPQEEVEEVFAQVRRGNLQLITSHHLHGQICKYPLLSLSLKESPGADVESLCSFRCCRSTVKIRFDGS